MSIIAEALKKIQESPPRRSERKFPEEAGRKERKGSFYIYVGLFTVILFFVFAGHMFGLWSMKPTKQIEEILPTMERPAFVGEAEVLEEPAGTAAPIVKYADLIKKINLNGIMYTSEKPLVVINDSIWGVGDAVGDFKIVEIQEDFIAVSSGDEKFIIKLKR